MKYNQLLLNFDSFFIHFNYKMNYFYRIEDHCLNVIHNIIFDFDFIMQSQQSLITD